MSDLKQKLIDKLHDPDGDAIIVGYELIEIILEQQAALEKITNDTGYGAIANVLKKFARSALASTAEKLKALGCEGE